MTKTLSELTPSEAAHELAAGSGSARFQTGVLTKVGHEAVKKASLGDIGQSVGNWYKGLNPAAKYGIGGALAGGGLGLASGLMDEDDTTPTWSRALTGALAGGAAGGGLGLAAQNMGQRPPSGGPTPKPPGYMRLGDQEVVLNQDLSPEIDRQLSDIQGKLNGRNPAGSLLDRVGQFGKDHWPSLGFNALGAGAGLGWASEDLKPSVAADWHGNEDAFRSGLSRLSDGGQMKKLMGAIPDKELQPQVRQAILSGATDDMDELFKQHPHIRNTIEGIGGEGMRPSTSASLRNKLFSGGSGQKGLVDRNTWRGRAGTLGKATLPGLLTGGLTAWGQSSAARNQAREQGRNLMQGLLDSGQATPYGGG